MSPSFSTVYPKTGTAKGISTNGKGCHTSVSTGCGYGGVLSIPPPPVFDPYDEENSKCERTTTEVTAATTSFMTTICECMRRTSTTALSQEGSHEGNLTH